MLAEKLLLHLLITLAPVHFFSYFLEYKQKKYSPFLCGLLCGATASICLIFSYEKYGFYWDLRYVPIILSFLYCGPVSGGITVFIYLTTRTLMHGGNLLFAFIGCGASIIAPLLVMRIFKDFSPNKRILMVIIVGIWPPIVSFISLLVYLSLHENSHYSMPFGYDIFLLGFIQILSLGLSTKVIESSYEKRRLKDEMKRAEKLNTLGELAASIAHEVRNPLTVVKGFLQLMQKEEHGKKYEYFSLVLSELGRAEAIINDYLNFAKPKLDKIEQFPLINVIKEVISLLDPLAMKKGVQIESKLNNIDINLTTDRSQLKQALVNFIKNAIEATEQGGNVTIRLILEKKLGCIFISDTGKGMSEEQLSRIGTLFYTTKEKGTGLGTSVSIRIIEAMKGKVVYKSELGFGTEVKLILPIDWNDENTKERKTNYS
jgi:two-component system, sporulation sensor kinase B